MLNRALAFVAALSVLAAAASGCRAPAAAPAATPPALPTSAAVGGTNIVAISPPAQQCCPKQTLPQFLGITGACEGIKQLIDRLRNRLGSIFPGLEAKPEILSITDPANLQSDNPAIASAAAVKSEEDAAAQKAKAIAYLASVGCAGCYPGIEDALLAALDDCTELVRFETAKALRSTANMPCKNCCRSACCGPKIRAKLIKLAYETDAQGCYLESSDRVRRMARLALANCNCVPEKPGQTQQQRLPEEGPGAEEAPVPAPVAALPAAAGAQMASVLRSATPVRDGAVLDGAVRAMSYEEALSAYGGNERAAQAGEMEVAWEMWSARPEDFGSRTEAVGAMTMARTQIMSLQAGHFLPPQLRHAARDWSDPNSGGSAALARAIMTTPVGGVSGVVEDPMGWHLVRVIARRPRVLVGPAVAPVVQPVGYQAQLQPGSSPATPPRIVAVRQADCNCK